MTKPWYAKRYRRLILDAHVGDWDDGFMTRYDPEAIADACAGAGVEALLLYCLSHVGLCFWPTPHGKHHAGLAGRDVVGELVESLHHRDLIAIGYISIMWDNWAFLEHPDWRQVPAGFEDDPVKAYDTVRYGTVCLNAAGYRQYLLAQTDDLHRRYAFDGGFFDMTFWPHACVCEHCRRRFRDEHGTDIPQTVDWLDADWCAFQAARERWLAEFARELTATAKAARGGLSVCHNFAASQRDWHMGVPLAATDANDYLAADFYGDALEQLFVCKLFSNLSQNRPVEFVTTCCPTPGSHVQLRGDEDMRMLLLAAALFGAAFMWIDPINLDGSLNPRVYERIGEGYREYARYAKDLGGEPIEDIAVYFSSESKMDFADNGRPLAEAKGRDCEYPHMRAARGACRVLQRAHLPFGVITRKQLADLDRYKVVVLPNVLRMDAEEVEAFRAYVRGGGRLYASGYTSLTDPDGTRHADFALADVFGCHFAADDLGRICYLFPVEPGLAEAAGAQDYLDKFGPGDYSGALRLADAAEGEALATLTLPYRNQWGTVFDGDWGSIHSAPPWQDLATPAVVENAFGAGRAIYAAADLEASDGPNEQHAFLYMVRRLLAGAAPTYEADTHPAVWVNAADQPGRSRYVVGLLNYQSDLPPVPVAGTTITLRPPKGRRFTKLLQLPDQAPVEFTTEPDGAIRAELDTLETFAMLAAEYA